VQGALCPRNTKRELPLDLYSRAEKSILPTYIQAGKALFLRVEDIGRRRLLTQPRPGRQLPVVSAFRVSEGQLHRCPVPHPIPVSK
jgi:hypothetical protein